MAFWDIFRRKKEEDDFASSRYSLREVEPQDEDGEDYGEGEEETCDYGYRYLLTLPNSNALLFHILDSDQDIAGHILCTPQGKITVLFDERWSYEQSDIDSLTEQVQNFFNAL